jgi:hypothetical protein
MQRVDTARSEALQWSSSVQHVHDFGSYSVYRDCGGCRGNGKVNCGGCMGSGRNSCGSCGGAGSRTHTVTHTRWNGRNNETYSQHVRQTCSSCGGGGRVICFGCGGSGKKTCGECSGHGYFTDISHVQAVAKPSWRVPKHSGLASDALVRALVARGPNRACALVPFDLAGSGYSESDEWVVRYEGLAEVLELGIDVLNNGYNVAAVGAHVTPITTPPVFDQLLRSELDRVEALNSGGRARSNVRREAQKLFAAFRDVPVLDRSLQALSRLSKERRSDPAVEIVRVAEGYVSSEAATSIGDAFLQILDKVSPANSRSAWAVVALFPAVATFYTTADSFASFSPAAPWNALVPLGSALLTSALAMLAISPLGWLVSSIVSSLMRRKVPAEYRQRGRNWVPLGGACIFVMTASLVGAVYGAAGVMQWVPTVHQSAEPLIEFARAHMDPSADAYRFVADKATPPPIPVGVVSEMNVRRQVQLYLILHGFLHGEADGNVGPRTTAAISKYERQEHLGGSTSLPDLLDYMMRASGR